MTLVAGIDPGSSGAIAWLRNGKLVAVEDLPVVIVTVGKVKRRRLDVAAFRDRFLFHAAGAECFAVLEEVGPMPGDGTVGAFAFGRCSGLIEGVLTGLSVPHLLVKPADWKRSMGVTKDKGLCRIVAGRMFPQMSESFARVRDDGRAEAALLAAYGITRRASLA